MHLAAYAAAHALRDVHTLSKQNEIYVCVKYNPRQALWYVCMYSGCY